MGLLENIRNKPHEHKIRIIWVVAAIVVVLLLVAWVLVGRMELDPNQSLLRNIRDRIGSPGETFPKIFNKE